MELESLTAAARRRDQDQASYTKFPGRQYSLADGTEIKLEDLFLVPQHPQRPQTSGKTYIYYQDTSPQGLAKTYAQEKRLETPQGSRIEIEAMGYLRLRDGDAVFARSLNGDQEPMNDVIQVWVADGKFWTAEMKAALDKARDGILGPRKLRDRKKPHVNNDKKVGGTAFERSPIAKAVKKDTRAYTIGTSIEAPTSITAPAASSKLAPPNDEMVQCKNSLLQVTAQFAMGAMSQGPDRVQNLIKARAKLMNFARIGHTSNYAYATAQLNLAPASKPNGKLTVSLARSLGFFGGAHFDRGDEGGFMSNMTSNHDIPDDYDPGMFFLLQLGVFIVLEKYSSINFFGHRKHGGTPPLCPEGQEPYKHAYRFVVIWYPPRRIVNGTARVTLAALPNKEALIMPPELLHTGCDNRAAAGWNPPASTVRSSFVREGAAIMAHDALVALVVRWLILFVFYVLDQLPANFNIRLDPDLIVKAITYEDEDGIRRNTGPWDLAPGHRVVAQGEWNYFTGDGDRTDQNAIRSQSWVEWEAYQTHAASHVPYLGRRGPLQTHFSKPKKLKNMMTQPESDADDEESDSDTDSDEDSEDPDVIEQRAARQRKRKAHEDKRKAERKLVRAQKMAAKAEKLAKAKPKPKGKGKQPKPVESESDSGISAPELPTSDPAEMQSSRAERAANREARREGTDHLPETSSTSAIKKRKATSAEPNEQLPVVSAGITNQSGRGDGPTFVVEITKRPFKAPVRRTADFIQTVTLDTLADNLNEIQHLALQLSHGESGEVHAAVKALEQSARAMRDAPMAVDTLLLVHDIWPHLFEIMAREATVAWEMRTLRVSVMDIHERAWTWLNVRCYQQIVAEVEQPSYSTWWLFSLARDVRNILETRSNKFEFQAANYGLPLSTTFEYYRQKPSYTVTVDDIAKQATEIIGAWLGFPQTLDGKCQAIFIGAVIAGWGANALHLDEVWQCYCSPNKYLFHGSKNAEAISHRLEVQLPEELAAHPLSQIGSSHWAVLSKITNLVQRTNYDLYGLPPADEDDGLEAEESVGSDTGETPIVSGVHSAPTENIEPGDALPVGFHQFLLEAAAILDPAPTASNEFQSRLLEKMDYLYPYRELAPSRKRILEPGGPFALENVRTDAGMLSALIFRNITFNTPFLFKYRTMFNDIDDFWDVVEGAKGDYCAEHDNAEPPPSYFCLPNAYGPYNPRKLIELADGYADQLGNDSWAAKFADRHEIPFWECYNWLSGTVENVNASGKRRKRFPELGPLGSYLLTADLVYAGAVMEPTLEEMGQMVQTLDKGAVKGLQALGLIPQVLPNRKSGVISKAFQKLYHIVAKTLPKDMQTRIGFNAIVLEHALCKYSRCHSKGWFVIDGERHRKRRRKS